MNDAINNENSIAIVGMAGRFPKARNLDEFWRNLCNGVEAISFFTDEELAPSAATARPNSGYVKARAILENPELFDAAFFGMNPKEAELTDPQHRLFLECSWEALENANCDPQTFGRPIGIFAGMSTNTYLAHNLAVSPALTIGSNGEFPAMIGNEHDYLTSRVSYKLNLTGPSLNIQTACSTSLVAVCVACQNLLTYQCDLALAGAVSVSFPQKRAYVYQEGGITSPDGHCRPFDVSSAGTVGGEGVGVVALKRLADALADGDAIYAVIKGFATNNDGSLKVGFTAPSIQGQAEVIAMAQAMAGIEPRTISYIEAHGTGTPLGDPVEIEGLTRAFRLGTDAKQFCAIGSIKGNIGHLDTAAGIAGLIKTALMLHHKKIPPSLHFKSPNPKINFADSPFQVNASLVEWNANNTPRRAGISSFGIGGTNAHVVLEEAPVFDIAAGDAGSRVNAHLLPLSAKNKTALHAAAKNLAQHLKEHKELDLAKVAFTLQTGRRAFEHRAILVCHNHDDAVSALESFDPKRILTGVPEMEQPPVVFMFPGQSAQYVNMGRGLYRTEPVFRATVDHCCLLLEPHLGFDLREVIYPGSTGVSSAGTSTKQPAGETPALPDLNQTATTQPALFVIEYALAKLWMSWGVQPAAMIGHSVGEYVAACLAGVFSLEDALALIAARGRMMQALPPGTMLAVRLPEQEVRPLLSETISLAAVNGANACVVSGPDDAIKVLQEKLALRNVSCVPLQTSHAFHSAMMDAILTPFAELVKTLERRPPHIPFVSNVTGTWIADSEATDPQYWANHLRHTVRFADGINELFNRPRVFLEVGPGQILGNLARQNSARKTTTPVLSSLARSKDELAELDSIFNALGQLWLNGISPAWEKLRAQKPGRVWLPGYQFERKTYWIAPALIKTPPLANKFLTNPILVNLESFSKPIPAPVAENRAASRTENSTRSRLRALLGNLSGLDSAAFDSASTFTQLGFDSLFLTQASVALERDFGVRVAFRQLLEEFSTLDSLADHLDKNLPVPVWPLFPVGGNGRVHSGTGDPGATQLAPLTESQREIWFATQISEAASCVYNECRLVHLRGRLQTDGLRDALQQLVARHEALRTTFAPGGDVQQIHPSLTVEIRSADWAHLDTAARAEHFDAAQIEEARQPFDLIEGPLVRARLIRLAFDHHVFVMTVHHLVCDGYSFSILLRELGEFYSAACGGGECRLPPALQFSDYARLQAKQEQGREHSADEKYWLEQFADGGAVLELPTDRPRGSAWKFEGARAWRNLPKTLGDQLKRFSAGQGGTLFTTFFAAYALLLRRLAGQKETIIGIPLADRAIAGGETLVGHCVNFLPLRGVVEDERTFTGHLAVMQKIFLDADEHGRYAFGTLLQKLNLSRDPCRMPLVSATFNLERVTDQLKFVGLEIELAGNAHSAASFDVSFDVTDAPEGLQLNCRYNASVFTAPTIQRWLAHFQTLLEAIVATPHLRLRDLSLLTEAERRKVLEDWNDTRTDYPRYKGVHQIFEEQAAKTPRASALEFQGRPMTYRELNERANRLAHHLQKKGVVPGNIVALCLERSPEMIVALLGILKCGAAYLPLDPSDPTERLALLLQKAQAAMVLTEEKWMPVLRSDSQPVVCLDASGRQIAGEPATNPATDVAAERLAYISFTSGSTGEPKGVCVPHRAVVRLVKNTNYVSLTADEVLLQFAPLAFDASTFEIWGALLNGARLVIFPPGAPSLTELGEFIRERGITTLWLTAGLLHQLIEDQAAALRGVRQLLAGGDVLSVPHVKRALKQLPGCRLINGYGPTENTTFTCCHSITEAGAQGHSIPIGRPIANTQVYVLDEHGQPVPIGVAGELYAGGDGLAVGYLNQPELTAEKFISNPLVPQASGRSEFSRNQTGGTPVPLLYKTGDRVRWLADGTIEFLGRMDSQVKIRGHRVELGEIETAMARHPGVRECVVIARHDRSGDKRLTAYFASSASAQPTDRELRRHLQTALPDYMIPSAFVQMESLPLTSSGKVDRKVLSGSVEKPIPSGLAFVAASDDFEKRVAEIWQDVLDRPQVGANDDFFELGGHSLLALRLVARVEKVFGKKIPVASVFHSRTVAQMANQLREKTSPANSSSIVEIQGTGTRPPLMLVHGAGGGMFWGYTALAGHLGPDQPVYAFKSRGVDGGEEFESIEEMARHYVAELRAFQPRGPYHIGGYCFGGNVAYEMARQLRAAGQKIAVLALINCMPPNSSYDRPRLSATFCARFFKNLIYWGNYVLHLKRGHRREFLRWKFRAIKSKLFHTLRLPGAAALNFDIEDFVDLTAQPEGRRSLWEAHVHALFKHQPKPYAGGVTLFRTRGHSLLCSFDEAFGWRDLATGGVVVQIVSGAHESIMDEPHVRELATKLRACLDNANTLEKDAKVFVAPRWNKEKPARDTGSDARDVNAVNLHLKT